MANYTKKFQKPYTNGYKDRPDTSTPVTATIKNMETEALLSIEEYLANNDIPSVSVARELMSGTHIADITVNGTKYSIYAPSQGTSGSNVSYSAEQTEGTLLGTLTIDNTPYKIYAPAGSGGSVTVDSELSADSENPVQNKVVKAAIDDKMAKSLETLTKYEQGKTGTLSFSTTDAMAENISSYASMMNSNFALAFNAIMGCAQYKNYLSVSSIDCDLLTDYKAIYFVNGSAETNNLPTGFGGGILLNSTAGSTSAANYQYAIDFTNGKQYFRKYYHGTWTGWGETTSSGGSVTIDSEFSTESKNPLQNDVITAEFAKKLEVLEDDTQAPDAVNFDLDSELSLSSAKGVQNKVIAKEFRKYATKTQSMKITTTEQGISAIGISNPDVVVSAICTDTEAHIVLPFRVGNNWFVKVLAGYTFAVVASKDVNITIYYETENQNAGNTAINPLSMAGNFNFKSKIALADIVSADNITIAKDSTTIPITGVTRTDDTKFKLQGDFTSLSVGDVIKVQTDPGFFFDSNLQSISEVSVVIGDPQFLIKEPQLDGSVYLTLLYNQGSSNYYATKRAVKDTKYWAIGLITYCGPYTVPLIISNVSEHACVTSTYMGGTPTTTYTFEYDGKTYYCNANVQGAQQSSVEIRNASLPLYDMHDSNYTDNEAGCVYMAKKLLDFYFGKEEFPQ